MAQAINIPTTRPMAITSVQQCFLALFILLIGHLGRRCQTNPNPFPPTFSAEDLQLGSRFRRPMIITWCFGYYAMLFFAPYHALLTAFPTLRTIPTLICPNPAQLSSSTFTWSLTTITWIVFTTSTGLLRLEVFRELGTDFNFVLVRPQQGLKTGGLYRFMQHPSYTFGLPNTFLTVWFLLKTDGVLGCWLPAWAAQSWVLATVLAMLSWSPWWWVGLRVTGEENFLKREFGEEWRLWSDRTARFVPGLW